MGVAPAAFELGMRNLTGSDGERNLEAAARWLEIVGETQNDPAKAGCALINLGVMRRVGDGVEQNAAEAVRYYRAVLDAEIAPQIGKGPAAHQLGLLYFKGEGVEQSWEEAARYFEQAVAFGYEESQELPTVTKGLLSGEITLL
ncbi:MAG: sel1 repeat family protein [Thermoguttaceae bacterium]|nr:sel1 repeat family protein [Thermoguttaceae bacterium]